MKVLDKNISVIYYWKNERMNNKLKKVNNIGIPNLWFGTLQKAQRIYSTNWNLLYTLTFDVEHKFKYFMYTNLKIFLF